MGKNIQVRSPELRKSSEATAVHNKFLKQAGAQLEALAKENTRLHEKIAEAEVREKESQRRKEIVDAVLDAADQGRISHGQIRNKISSWIQSGHPAEYYRNLLTVNRNVAFADAEKTSESRSKGMDDNQTAVHHGEDMGNSLSRTTVEFHHNLRSFSRSNL